MPGKGLQTVRKFAVSANSILRSQRIQKYYKPFRLFKAEPNRYYIGLLSTLKTLQSDTLPLPEGSTCNKQCIECSMLTSWLCQNCNTTYCEKCFDITHHGGKVMRTHIFEDLLTGHLKSAVFHCSHLPYVNFCDNCSMEMCLLCTKSHEKSHVVLKMGSMVSLWFD